MIKIPTSHYNDLDHYFEYTWQWGGVETGFTFSVPIPNSHILTRYPTHTHRG